MQGAEPAGWSGWQVDASASPASGDPVALDDELAAVIRRAAGLGIPAWRVSVALGQPLAVMAAR